MSGLGNACEVRNRKSLATSPWVHVSQTKQTLRLRWGTRPDGERGAEGLAALAEGGVDQREDLRTGWPWSAAGRGG